MFYVNKQSKLILGILAKTLMSGANCNHALRPVLPFEHLLTFPHIYSFPYMLKVTTFQTANGFEFCCLVEKWTLKPLIWDTWVRFNSLFISFLNASGLLKLLSYSFKSLSHTPHNYSSEIKQVVFSQKHSISSIHNLLCILNKNTFSEAKHKNWKKRIKCNRRFYALGFQNKILNSCIFTCLTIGKNPDITRHVTCLALFAAQIRLKVKIQCWKPIESLGRCWSEVIMCSREPSSNRQLLSPKSSKLGLGKVHCKNLISVFQMNE